ncbi:hypothetical protein M5K25_020794 [Dendrobium thyrsiflorum]|uniref:Uncharacterized protein n=1 Tax=Dendrobium thyrsiflorum TaxID=117978 RepID=A0ABD0UAU7_DENTH
MVDAPLVLGGVVIITIKDDEPLILKLSRRLTRHDIVVMRSRELVLLQVRSEGPLPVTGEYELDKYDYLRNVLLGRKEEDNIQWSEEDQGFRLFGVSSSVRNFFSDFGVLLRFTNTEANSRLQSPHPHTGALSPALTRDPALAHLHCSTLLAASCPCLIHLQSRTPNLPEEEPYAPLPPLYASAFTAAVHNTPPTRVIHCVSFPLSGSHGCFSILAAYIRAPIFLLCRFR